MTKKTLRILRAALCAACLILPLAAFGQDATVLASQANTAYEAKDFARAAQLFNSAADAGGSKVDNYYNAACSYALAGQADDAFRALQVAVDAGLKGQGPADDPDFASLHADPRWAVLIQRFAAMHPELEAVAIMRAPKLSTIRRYLTGRRAIEAGVSVADTGSLFNQYYAFPAQFLGEYDEASRIYGGPRPVDDVVAAGFTHASDALPVVLAQAHGRQAVFLNESHGQSATRAANFALLAGLRADGFNVLAMETLATETPTLATTTPASPEHMPCARPALGDADLATRGYAIAKSGYYSLDPVYAQTIREALRLGFELVGYDNRVEGGVPEREANQARNLACVFKQHPRTRMVVIAGFSHIAEGKDFWVTGGAMAYRFRELTGIDPLTVDTTTQLSLDPAVLAFASAKGAARAPSFVLADASGKVYGTENFDLVLYVPMAAHREGGAASWLALGGARKATPVTVEECRSQTICFLAARRVGEQADAVPSDACVVTAPATGCTLFLTTGDYDVATWNDSEAQLGRQSVRVAD